jgi:hypothetical protein
MLLVGDVTDVVSDGFEFSLELIRVIPFFHFSEHESFSLSNSIGSIISTNSLHWPGIGVVSEIEHLESRCKRNGWLNIVSESNVWISFLESRNISHVGVIFFNFVSSQVVVVCVLGVNIVGSHVVPCAYNNIDSDLAIIIDLFSASFDCIDEVSVPDGSTIHKDVSSPFKCFENTWD